MLSIWLIYKGPEGAGIGQWYSAGLRAEWLGGSSPGRGREFLSGRPALEPHLASFPMGTRGSFPGSKAAGTWS
jgi:hypothetical protein